MSGVPPRKEGVEIAYRSSCGVAHLCCVSIIRHGWTVDSVQQSDMLPAIVDDCTRYNLVTGIDGDYCNSLPAFRGWIPPNAQNETPVRSMPLEQTARIQT